MESLKQKILATRVDPGSFALFWLAQAGFVFKTPSGQIVYTDPYLINTFSVRCLSMARVLSG